MKHWMLSAAWYHSLEKNNARLKLTPKLPGQLLKSKSRNSVNAQQSKKATPIQSVLLFTIKCNQGAKLKIKVV